MSKGLVSIIVSSYNYGRFLKECIDSALNQTYPHIEVVVVDDASTDNSRDIIADYGNRIIPILKEKNEGGRAASYTAYRHSKGEVVFFLDSDDRLCPTAVELAMELFQDPNVVKVHWPLWEISTRGKKTGHLDPRAKLPDGDLRERVALNGPFYYAYPSTSGNAYSRQFLEKVLPVPSETYGDAYLAVWALVSGTVKSIVEPQGFYRIHDHNTYKSKTFDKRVERDLRHAEYCCAQLSAYYQEKGIAVDTEIWKKNSWHYQLHLSVAEIRRSIPEGEVFILVDEDNWATGGSVAGRRALPFPERDGYHYGSPPDDATAIQELERQRQAGVSFMVFAWPAFWWLEYYSELHHYLRSRFPCVLENQRLIVFNMRAEFESSKKHSIS